MIKKLPLIKIVSGFSVFSLVMIAMALATGVATAASAYINPSQGRITQKQFLVSIYVESSATEPQIASSDIKVSYPTNVTVLSVNDGEFDSYLEKNYDATAKLITIKAVNNAGNYKQGKVKVASVNFEATTDTGAVKLTIDPTSEISGAGGEQLLTETIDSNYTLDIVSTDTTTTTDTTTDTTETTASAPVTGVNDTLQYILISAALLVAGGYLAVNQKRKI